MPQLVKPEQRATNIRSLLEKHKGQLAMALPKHITPDRMIRVALTAIQRTPKLLEADTVSMFSAIIQSAQLGLQPDGALGEAYLIPYENRKRGVVEVQFQPGYRGLLSLVRRSGELSTIEVRAVYAKDHFRFQYGINSILEHTPWDPGAAADPARYDDEESYAAAVDAGPLVAVYAIAKLKDGGVQWEVMRRHEVNAIRARSKSRDAGPWVTDYDAMAKKTVLKRLCKLLPMSVEAQTAMHLDDQAEVGIPQDLEIPAGLTPTPDVNGSALEQLTATLATGRESSSEPETVTLADVGITPQPPRSAQEAATIPDATPHESEIPFDRDLPEKPKRGK